ncbi:hypothetical protein BC628DRAFT_149626 [Trametes gibbosa]|nr:hypothetical protein BC628DRAFT_149626 [Trametes gibbosa]
MSVAATADQESAGEMREWEIVPEDWWKTSFAAISWSYKTKPGYSRPPHYHNLLARGRRRRVATDDKPFDEDVDLNGGLSGVRAAEESLKRYEAEVSILSPEDLAGDDSPAHSYLTTLARESWEEKVRELLGGILEPGLLPEVDAPSPDAPLWDLTRLDNDSPPPGTPSTSSGTTDSDQSTDSEPPPSTPKPSKASYARVVSSESVTSPTVLSPLPSKLLSAAALTFIPSTPTGPSVREPVTPPLTSGSNSSGDSPFSSPTYNFHFPSLKSTSPADRRESRSLPPLLQKDESGFYVEVPEDEPAGSTQSLNATRSTTPRRPSAAFLPAFLTDGSPSPRPRNSKTREIVDRLRSSGGSSSNRKTKKSDRTRRQSGSTAPKDGDLGLLDPPSESKAAQRAKTEGVNDGWITGVVSEDTVTSAYTIVTDDGWIIQGNARAPQQSRQQQQQPSSERPKSKHGHGHKRSSGSIAQSSNGSTSSFSPASHTSSLPTRTAVPLPALPQLYPGTYPASYGAPYTGGTPTTFMSMPFPMQARGPQWPMGFQPGMYPVYQPFGVMPAAPYGMVPVAPPLAQPSAFFDGKSKSGGTLVQ